MSGPATSGVVITAEQLGHLAGITAAELAQKKIAGSVADFLAVRAAALNLALDGGDCNTPARAALVTARVFTETERTLLVKEQQSAASGPGFANYLNRGGNLTLADCLAYCARGLLQVTFKNEYAALTAYARQNGMPEADFVARPDDLLLPQYLGIESAWYLRTHPAIAAAGDALAEVLAIAPNIGTPRVLELVDEVSCQVNAGKSRAEWIATHGELIDGAVAEAYNRNMAKSGAKDWKKKHGIYGLVETHRHFQNCAGSFGLVRPAA